MLAWGAAAIDLGSRWAAISAIPALAALQLTAALAVTVLAAIGVRLVEARRRPSEHHRRMWRLWVALAGALAVLVGRVAIAPIEPTVLWLTPALLVAPTSLTLELGSAVRAGSRPGVAVLSRFATAWCSICVVALVALALGPTRWADVDVRAAGSTAVGWSMVVVAVAAVVAAAVGGARAVALRFALVAVVGSLVPLADPGDVATRVLGATVVVLALYLPVASLRSSVSAVRVVSDRVVELGRRVGRSIGGSIRGVLRGCGRAWRSVLAFAAPRPPRARPELARRDRQGAALMGVISLAFVANGLWWAHRVGWQPTAHSATLMARSAQVGTIDHPLIGLVTSLGGTGSGAAHPGPLTMDLLAPFIRLFGVQNGALLAGATTTIVCWWVVVWSAWRAAGRAAAVAAWVTGALVLAIPALGAFWESNNISITLLALVATVLASWAASTGAWRAWWWAVGLGCLCAQSYIPHALIVIGPVLWAGLALAGARRAASDPDERRRIGHALRVGWLIGALAWLQPVLDVVLNEGGNVRALAGEVLNPKPAVGPSGFPRAMAWALSVPPRWGDVTGSLADAGTAREFIGGSLVSGVVVGVALGLLWWRTRGTTPSNERQLRVITLIVLVGAGVNATQLPQDFLRSFQMGWLVVASLLTWFAVAVSVGLALQRRLAVTPGQQWARVARFGALGVAAIVVLAAGLSGPDRIEDVKARPFTIDAMVNPLVDQTMTSVDTDDPILVLRVGSRLNEAATDTILSNLLVRGLDARVEPDTGGMNYGQRRIVDEWTGPVLWITSGLEPVKPDGRLLAAASVPGWSEERFDELADRVASTVRAAPRVELQPWVMPSLARYLGPWLPDADVCKITQEIRSGEFPLASLPPRLLLTLYGDLAVAEPALPPAVQEEASGLLGQAPLEVWLTDRAAAGPISSNDLLRDGTQCPPAPPPS